jgi:hypothetical protein
MALFTGHSNANKQIIELPVKTETLRTRITVYTLIGANTMGNAWYWYIESYTREAFVYVGMTAAAAAACAAAMVAAYTKTVSVPVVMADGSVTFENKTMVVADIRAVHVGGKMYQVEVNVNDPTYSLEPWYAHQA